MEMDYELDEKELIEAIMSDEENIQTKPSKSNDIFIINHIVDKWKKAKKLLESVRNLEDIFDLPKIILELAKLNKLVGENQKDLIGLKAIIISLTAEHEDFGSKALIAVQYMAELALRIDKLFPKGNIKILSKYDKDYITYTSEEAACLISLGFFCLYNFPSKSLDMPGPINFIGWYEEKGQIFKQKMKFLFNYFELYRLEEIESNDLKIKPRKISFERISFSKSKVQELDDDYWMSNDLPLSSVKIIDDKLIEDIEGTLMVDFANKYLGGGVMKGGCVQEEILFLVFPELLVSKIICAKMEASEAVVIVGAKRFSKYSQYRSKTKFEGTYDDKQPIDKFGRIDRTFVAIDAVDYNGFKSKVDQFYKNDMLRDLNKAFIGFIGDKNEIPDKTMKKISTGRWGCGAFNGNSELKFCLQWIAASANKRKMNFATFGESDCDNLERIYNEYQGKTISDLFKDLKLLRSFVQSKDKARELTKDQTKLVYEFIVSKEKDME